MKYDVIIVGSGAGGSAAAYHLTQTGKSVLLLERGRALPIDGSTLDVDQVVRLGRFLSQETWLDRAQRKFAPSEFANLGGKTKWYGAALLRFSAHEFEPDAAHHCRGWPIGAGEMEPYYAEAEQLLGVRSFAAEPDLDAIVSRLCASEPTWKRSMMPLGLKSEILQQPREARRFDGFALPSGAKADAEVAFLTRIKAQPNVRIETAATVVALTNKPDSPRVIDGVRLADGRLFQARRIVLAGGAMHSPRLLQDHVDDHGLNAELPAAALIGRRYKCHLNSALVAVSFGRKNDLLRKTVLLLNQRYPHSSVQNQGGVMDGDMIATQMPALMPHWVSEQIGRRAYAFWLTTEDGSHVDNRVISRSNGSRLPMLDYDPRRLPEALDEHRRLCRGMAQALWRQGYATVVKHMPLEATAHACGTLATGRDATQGVVDARGAVFGMDNLFVADGSALPRSSRVNPALTIYAWGLRVAANLDLEQAA